MNGHGLLTADYDILIAAGGDGTINQVANELIKQDAPSETCLAVIPLGTANDFATSLTIRDDDLVSAMQTAVKGEVITRSYGTPAKLGMWSKSELVR